MNGAWLRHLWIAGLLLLVSTACRALRIKRFSCPWNRSRSGPVNGGGATPALSSWVECTPTWTRISTMGGGTGLAISTRHRGQANRQMPSRIKP